MAPDAASQDDAVPPELIAQTRAAIAANIDVPTSHRRQSRADSVQTHSHDQETNPEASSISKSRDVSSRQDNEDNKPSPFGERRDSLKISQEGFDTQAKVTDDGRVNININQKNRRLSDLLVPALRSQLSLVAEEIQQPISPGYIPPSLGGHPGQVPPPKLNVVIHVVGSRGDVQPFVALGKVLKSTYGHRVRLATHPTFQTFVEENGLEFFSIGGDPAELMAFMVKNPGLMPGFDSLKSGDVGKRRKAMEEIILGCWRSCIESGNGLGAPSRPGSSRERLSLSGGINMDTQPVETPFIADAIIANPPSFAHVHIAEKLGVPLHLMFTMPWSPTQSFPHPLANIQSSNADVNMTNFLSYALVEMMTWQGLGDIINRFREHTLGLEPLSVIWGPGILTRLRIPYTYCWSPALIPKPPDWASHIDISGFFFLSLASSYTPPPDLAAFLSDGPAPIYIGFGSIVVDDPNALTATIFEAVRIAGVRALISKGWGGLGADALGVPEGVFMIGNTPHDWLFKHVSCVVHHGGAGTTAAGIAFGRPTIVVPFFGDQPFWGAMVARAGAGPTPIPFKQLTAENLATAILEALKPERLTKAQSLGARISQEKGSDIGGKSFHDHLEVDNLRCSLASDRIAVWRVKRTTTRLSALAATVLANEGLLDFSDLKLFRPREYDPEDGPMDPISGGASALIGTMASLTMGVADFPVEIFKAFKSRTSSASARGSEELSSSTMSTSTPVSRSPSQLNLSSESDELTRQVSGTTSSTSGSKNATSDGSDPQTSTTSVGSFQYTTPATKPRRGDALKQALSGKLARSRSSSPAGSRTGPELPNLTFDSAVAASKGISRIVEAGLRSPMDFTLGIARGFHNAPKLYGDETVRPQQKITDLQSGLKAAGKEFGYGFYDGISGLITQPMKGAEKEGAAGFVKGIGKGIGGLVLKPGAAIWGLPGYTFMGLHKEIRKVYGASIINYIISARVAQGYEHWRASTQEERLDIIKQWSERKSELQNERQRVQEEGPEGQESGHLSPRGFLQTRHLSFDERKRLHEERKAKRDQERTRVYGENGIRCPICSRLSIHRHDESPSRESSEPSTLSGPVEDQDSEYERAIKESIAATSTGDNEEDLIIERAIRASVRELRIARDSAASEEETLARAIRASVAEAEHDTHRSESEFASALEQAIQRSLNDAGIHTSTPHGGLGDAIEASKVVSTPHDRDRSVDSDNEEDIKLAKAASRASHWGQARTEEEIVLEYVKRQSAEEEKHKELLRKKGKSSKEDLENDEDLKKALEESLRTS